MAIRLGFKSRSDHVSVSLCNCPVVGLLPPLAAPSRFGATCSGKQSKAQTPSLHCAAATSYDLVFHCPRFRFGELKPFTPPVACSVAFLMTAWAEVWIWFRSALPSEALTHLTRQLWWRLSTSSGTSARRCSCDSAVEPT